MILMDSLFLDNFSPLPSGEAKKEALVKVMSLISEVTTLFNKRWHPVSTRARLKAGIWRMQQSVRGDKIDILPLLDQIKTRVKEYEVANVETSPTLIPGFLVEVDGYAGLKNTLTSNSSLSNLPI